MAFAFDLQWGVLAPAPGSFCVHCGRSGVEHMGACGWSRTGRFNDGATVL